MRSKESKESKSNEEGKQVKPSPERKRSNVRILSSLRPFIPCVECEEVGTCILKDDQAEEESSGN